MGSLLAAWNFQGGNRPLEIPGGKQARKWALIPKPYPYRFMIDLKEEQSNEYLKKVSAMAQRAGCQVNIVRYLFASAMVFV